MLNVTSISASISAFMALWQLVMMLVPMVKQLVQTAESLFPAGGQGQTKLSWVKDELEKIFGGLDGVVMTFAQVWPKLEDIIKLYVDIANKAGWTHEAVDPSATPK